MVDQRTADLPEGTDSIIEGAAAEPTNTPALTAEPIGNDQGDGTVTVDTSLVREKEIPAPAGLAERPVTGSGSAKGGLANSGTDNSRTSDNSKGNTSSQGIADRLRSSGEKLSSQAGERARGLVSQGLDRTSEALANVSRMIGDTAPGIEERLGPEYGDYARRAASAIEHAANNVASKDPDELIDDTREFVRNSPGVALAGAAVLGFVVARLVKGGLAAANSNEDDED